MLQIFAILIVLILNLKAFSQKVIYQDYTNDRYAYSFKYPNIVTQQPESQNGDGAIFTNKNNQERIRCWGKLDVDTDDNKLSLKQNYLKETAWLTKQKCNINYKVFKQNYFIISGINKEGNIFYEKVISNKETTSFNYLHLNYPNSEKTIWNSILKTIVDSFK